MVITPHYGKASMPWPYFSLRWGPEFAYVAIIELGIIGLSGLLACQQSAGLI
jgi:hypothetical protein